jgi:putative Mn2+ efflux pump MntP
MDPITIVLIALGLAMDCFAVSIASGLAMKKMKINNALKIAVFFGSFHAFMLLIGWLAGLGLKDFISGIDHWIAFGLLTLVGCKLIYESIRFEAGEKEIESMSVYTLLVLSLATSIDALAVGVTFAFLKISILTPILVIVAVTFTLSFLGVHIGSRVGHLFERRIGIVGGLILIAIGIRILVEHLA